MIDETRAGSDGSADGYVEFYAAGDPAKGEFRCSGCGYGVAIASSLPQCPMCGGTSWERRPWSPFSRADWDPRSLPPIA